MAKLTLTDLTSLTSNETTAVNQINANGALIETALENISYATQSASQQPLMDSWAKLFEQQGFASDIESEKNQASRTKIDTKT